MLADASVFIWFAVAMAIGFIGFFVMLIALALRAFKAAYEHLSGRAAGPRGLARAGRGELVCPHSRCGHVNARNGVYCSRCGRPLDRGSELDAYG